MPKKKRTDYHRKYYQRRAEELAENRSENRRLFDQCVSYWQQKLYFKREIPGLIAKATPEMIEKAKARAQELANQPVEVEISSCNNC
jgi:hypothetical protein